ncbi:hypothetical protein N7599_05195 [Stenotrophomonas sp. GD04032]|nr:hypothetical protein [Stenotrophomonas sp. GD04032]MCR1818225.1 hypothetical protein [Stenotrophomonas muris]MDG9973180.1 hypothetical protein [Stenotrophomonas sp. GD04032]
MSLRIIIADDHPVVRIGTRAVIESSGVGRVVGEADSAQALMTLLANQPCDLLSPTTPCRAARRPMASP